MPEAPIVKRGDRYFCPECGHLMEHPHSSCPVCNLIFKGEVQDEVRPKKEPLKIPEIEEKYAAVHTQRYIWTAVLGTLILAALAILLLILLRR